jgi:hypothetical protein
LLSAPSENPCPDVLSLNLNRTLLQAIVEATGGFSSTAARQTGGVEPPAGTGGDNPQGEAAD